MSPHNKAQWAMDAARTESFYCCCLCDTPMKLYIFEISSYCSDSMCLSHESTCKKRLHWSGNTGPGATEATPKAAIERQCKFKYLQARAALAKFDDIVTNSLKHKAHNPLKWMLEPPHD